MRTLATIIGLALAGVSSAASATPIWEQYPRLLCRGEDAAHCDATKDTCYDQKTNAIFELDFQKRTLTAFGNMFVEDIVATNQATFRDKVLSEQAFLSSGRVMTFRNARTTVAGLTIDATLVGSSLYGSGEIMMFQCALGMAR